MGDKKKWWSGPIKPPLGPPPDPPPPAVKFRGATYLRVASMESWLDEMIRRDNFNDERLDVKGWLQNLEVAATHLVNQASDDEMRAVLSDFLQIQRVVDREALVNELVSLAAQKRYNELSQEGKDELLDSPYFR